MGILTFPGWEALPAWLGRRKADFRPDRDLVLSYAEVAHRAIVDQVLKLTANQLEEQVKGLPGEPRPAWRVLAGVIGDSTEHVGQINYLGGMTSGLGWR